MVDLCPKLVVAGVVELELLSPKPREAAEHLGEDTGAEAAVLLGGEPAEALEAVAAEAGR